MKLKLPENFGGLSIDGEAVELKADKAGVVDVNDATVIDVLRTHGATEVKPTAKAAE